MGFFKRLSNIVSGKANKALDKVENPLEQLDLSIRKKQEALENAKKQSATFIGSIPANERKINELTTKANEYITGAKKAKEQGKTELALEFLKKKNSIEEEKNSIITINEKAKTNAALIKSKIESLEKEINAMKVKKTELQARSATAEATASVNELLAGLDDDSNLSLLEIEAKIEEKENYAAGLDTYKDTTEDDLKSILSASTEADLLNELDNL